jgi:DNA-directed RNA polymerase sigma subunit (sigma70/sigma32)
MDEMTMAFAVHRHETPAIEVRVNFGVFAGREATPAEIDRLAEWLLDEVGEVSIISEERHEIDAHVEASVHQVRIEVASDRVPADDAERKLIEDRILERAEHWARVCVSERHAEVADGV